MNVAVWIQRRLLYKWAARKVFFSGILSILEVTLFNEWHQKVQFVSILMNHPFIILAMCRGHTHLLWRKPHCDGRKGDGRHLCHLSCSLPFPAGWIHWPGSLYRQNQDLFHDTCDRTTSHFDPNCVLGVWHGHAAALPVGSGRPEEQTCACGQRANHGGPIGFAHWDLARQQQRLCYQPHQRHWAEDLHCHGRLGSWRLQVCRKDVCHSIVFEMSSFFMDLFFVCQDKGFVFV